MWGACVQRRRNLLNLPAEGTGKLAIWVALQSDLWQSKLNLKSACFTRTLDEEQRQAVPHAPRAKGPAPPSRQRGCQCFFDKRVKQKYPAAHERETKHIAKVNFGLPGKRALSSFQVWCRQKVTWCSVHLSPVCLSCWLGCEAHLLVCFHHCGLWFFLSDNSENEIQLVSRLLPADRQ